MKEEELTPISEDLPQKVNDIISNLDPIQHLKKLAYPRLAGTEGNEKAAEYIEKSLKSMGFEPDIQEFYFPKSKLLPKLLPPLVIILWGIVSILNLIIFDNYLFLSIIVLLLPAGVVFAVIKFDWIMKFTIRNTQKKIKEMNEKIEDGTLDKERFLKAKNFIINLGPNSSKKHVLFTAHYDSISLKVPTKIMMVSGIIGAAGLTIYSLAYFVNIITDLFFNFNFILLNIFLFIMLLIITLIALGIVFGARMFRTNISHGIIDDGTGIALLLELSRFLNQQKIVDCKFTFGFFNAEELGLIGSGYYFSTNKFDKNKLHVISIDMIGEKAPLSSVKCFNPVFKIPMNKEFNSHISSIAKKLNIEIKLENFLYPGSDFAHWQLNGYNTNWFINKSSKIHSVHDNLNNLNEELVLEALKLILGYLIEFLLSKG